MSPHQDVALRGHLLVPEIPRPACPIRGTVLDTIPSESTNNGGSASAGRRTVRQKWRLPTTTKNDMKPQSTNNLLPIPHPGDVLREDFMKPLGLSACAVAKGLGVAPITVSLLARGKRNVSPEMALRLARWSGASVEFWLGLQSFHDRRVAEREKGSRILREVTPLPSFQPA